MFFFNTSVLILLFLVYVDDILVTGGNQVVVQSFTERLSIFFSLKDLGELHSFLSLEVRRDSSWIYLSQ